MPRRPRLVNPRRRRAMAAVTPVQGTVVNPYPIFVDLFWSTTSGGATSLQYLGTVYPDDSFPNDDSTLPAQPSGAVLAAYFDPTGATVGYTGSYTAGYVLSLPAPNSIPLPSMSVAIPQDTPPALVGAGQDPAGLLVTREQYWAKASESYSLAPNETRTVSLVQTSGINSSSSTLDQISTALSTSASAGWGPVSASVSASLNATSTVQHQVTLTEQTTSSTVIQLSSGDDPLLVIYWQLMERIIWWNSGSYDAVEFVVTLNEDETSGQVSYSPWTTAVASLTVGHTPLVPMVSAVIGG